MHFIADLHIHSRFSRATSKQLSARHLAAWARCKGIDVLGTGDFTHPQWRAELREQLERDPDSGLYRLKVQPEALDFMEGASVRPHDRAGEPLFCLQTEISSIYKRGGKVRKVHNLIYVPTLDDADRLSARLAQIGNLNSDGRPILGLDSRDLLEILLETVPEGVFIPAHIWTPWFALFGSKSGFDRLEDCFADLSPHIFALETGLSSDPAMNRCVSALDGYCLISNSDAHSGANLGREANLFAGTPSYNGMFDALRRAAQRLPQDAAACDFLGTMEFYPEEGKYHLDGHRACNVMLEPRESEALGNICPVCGKPLTVGVLHRVLDLADRPGPAELPNEPQARPLIPLPEVISEILGVGPASRKVAARFSQTLRELGPELDILCHLPVDLVRAYWEPLGEAVDRMRRGQVFRQGGYDGEYGIVRVFAPEELNDVRSGSASLPGLTPKKRGRPSKAERPAGSRAEPSATATPPAEGTGQSEPCAQTPQGATTATAQPHCGGRAEAGQFHTLPLLQVSLLHQADRDTQEGKDARQPASSAASTRPRQPEQASPQPGGIVYSTEQAAALQAGPQPVLVLAGPGAGKTRVLTGRLQWLITEGTAACRTLAVTFTRRAAQEIRERLLAVLPEDHVPHCDTLHGLAWQLMQQAEARLQLLSEEAAFALFCQANADLKRAEARASWENIALARETQQPLAAHSGAEAAFTRYTAAKTATERVHYVDYADLLDWLSANALRFRGRWQHILVDEVQDLSAVQLAILQALLPEDGQGFFGIGDPDQAIYGFRGASGQSEASLRALWPQLQVFQLGQSYRASQAVLSMAQELLQGQAQCGRLQAVKTLEAQLELFAATDDRAEARWIARHVQQLLGATSHTLLDQQHRSGRGRAAQTALAGTLSPGDIAVLVRIKAQIPPIVAALEQAGIPCAAPLQEAFWQDETCAALLPWLAEQCAVHLPCALTASPEQPLAQTALPWQDGQLPPPEQLQNWLAEQSWPGKLFFSGRAWRALCRQWQSCGSWASFFEQLAWLHEAECIRSRAERVQILTMHASKGLEFRAVFLPGLEQGLLPLHRELLFGPDAAQNKAADVPPQAVLHQPLQASLLPAQTASTAFEQVPGAEQPDRQDALAEERRLLYVALTRASEALFVSHCERRTLYGRQLKLAPSAFLQHIASLCHQTVLATHTQKKEEQLKLL